MDKTARPKLIQQQFLKWLVPPIRVSIKALHPLMRDSAIDKSFDEINQTVIEAKATFDKIPPQSFDAVMRSVDLYVGLKRRMRSEFGMMISTNASLKMYELIIQMRLLACNAGALTKTRAFCNAELPGAFIVAINHYIKTMCPETNFDWVGSSYYPTADITGSALGDQYKIYASNRDHWLMGPVPNAMPEGSEPITGDVTDANVIAELATAVHARFGDGATLYTSDAGIDVSSDYGKQEELTALLNFGQVLCGILTLAPGGHLVTKQYTFFTSFSRSIVALLAALFDEMYVVKPRTSRPVNSEVYLVGKGFRGIDAQFADALLERIAIYRSKPDSTPCDWGPIIDPDLMKDTDAVLLRVSKQLYGRQQVAFLNEAADVYRQGNFDRKFTREAFRAQEQWLVENPVRRIRPDVQLATGGASGQIIAKQQIGGLRLDMSIIQDMIPSVGQFHLEHFQEDRGIDGVPNYLFVNQEFLFDWDIEALKSEKAIALCKTRYACAVLASVGVKNSIYTGFTSRDIYNPQVPRDPHLVVHLAGLSWLKGTLEVLRGWFEHGGTELDAILFITRQQAPYSTTAADLAYWDALQPTLGTYRGIAVECKHNVYLTRNRLTDAEFAMIANTAMVHLCPSITEGWGHIINTARAVNSIVITTDAAPMNELIDSNCGLLVQTNPARAVTLRELNPLQRKYYTPEIAQIKVAPVAEGALMHAVTVAINDRPVHLALAARQRYLASASQFEHNMHHLLEMV